MTIPISDPLSPLSVLLIEQYDSIIMKIKDSKFDNDFLLLLSRAINKYFCADNYCDVMRRLQLWSNFTKTLRNPYVLEIFKKKQQALEGHDAIEYARAHFKLREIVTIALANNVASLELYSNTPCVIWHLISTIVSDPLLDNINELAVKEYNYSLFKIFMERCNSSRLKNSFMRSFDHKNPVAYMFYKRYCDECLSDVAILTQDKILNIFICLLNLSREYLYGSEYSREVCTMIDKFNKSRHLSVTLLKAMNVYNTAQDVTDFVDAITVLVDLICERKIKSQLLADVGAALKTASIGIKYKFVNTCLDYLRLQWPRNVSQDLEKEIFIVEKINIMLRLSGWSKSVLKKITIKHAIRVARESNGNDLILFYNISKSLDDLMFFSAPEILKIYECYINGCLADLMMWQQIYKLIYQSYQNTEMFYKKLCAEEAWRNYVTIVKKEIEYRLQSFAYDFTLLYWRKYDAVKLNVVDAQGYVPNIDNRIAMKHSFLHLIRDEFYLQLGAMELPIVIAHLQKAIIKLSGMQHLDFFKIDDSVKYIMPKTRSSFLQELRMHIVSNVALPDTIRVLCRV